MGTRFRDTEPYDRRRARSGDARREHRVHAHRSGNRTRGGQRRDRASRRGSASSPVRTGACFARLLKRDGDRVAAACRRNGGGQDQR